MERRVAPRHGRAGIRASERDLWRRLYAGLGTTIVLGPKVTVKAEAGQPDGSERLAVVGRIIAPADEITRDGTRVLGEIGHPAA
jgi:hypothetical protein